MFAFLMLWNIKWDQNISKFITQLKLQYSVIVSLWANENIQTSFWDENLCNLLVKYTFLTCLMPWVPNNNQS